MFWFINRCAPTSSSFFTPCTGSCVTCLPTWTNGGRWLSWRRSSATCAPSSPTLSGNRAMSLAMRSNLRKRRVCRRKRSVKLTVLILIVELCDVPYYFLFMIGYSFFILYSIPLTAGFFCRLQTHTQTDRQNPFSISQ